MARAGPVNATAAYRPPLVNNAKPLNPGYSSTMGVALMLCAFFCFAVMDTSVKWLVLASVPALQVVFMRYAVHFLWVLVLYVPARGFTIASANRPGALLFRAFLLFFSTSCNFTALKYLPLTTTIAIFFAAPLVVCLLSIPVLKEQVGLRRFLAVATGFVGVLVVVQPGGQAFDWHIIYSIMAMLSASGYFVMSRLIAGSDTNAVTQFYTAGLASLLIAPVAFYYWQWPANLLEWGLMLLIGSFGMLGHSVLTRAHEFAEASFLAPTVYSQIIYITLLGWLIFDTVPTMSTVIGVAIIIASGVYIWQRERLNSGKAIAAGSAAETRP